MLCKEEDGGVRIALNNYFTFLWHLSSYSSKNVISSFKILQQDIISLLFASLNLFILRYLSFFYLVISFFVHTLASLLEDLNIFVSLTAMQHTSVQTSVTNIYWVAQIVKLMKCWDVSLCFHLFEGFLKAKICRKIGSLRVK